jgi:DNA (cytosine-5)-methyltransferase 1
MDRKLSTVPSRSLIDLFCGAGGLSLGFQAAGFRSLCAFDHWESATATYAANFSHPVHRGEIVDSIDLPSTSIIAGGPPCQGFSSAGMRKVGDNRNTLVGVFARIVAARRPTAFVFENVEGFLTGGDGRFVFELLDPLIEAGYQIHLRKVNAATFGVPQHRKRVIALGGLGWDPQFPEPTHRAYGAPGASLGSSGSLPPAPTLGDALNDLPLAREFDANEEPCPLDHTYTALRSEDRARATLLKPGQCMRDLPERLWHVSYRRRAFRRVVDGTPTERRGGAPAGLRRLRPDEPSKAITGGAVGEFLHPEEHRPLTIRECARIQTFPDSFVFMGPRRDRVQLIGNAVPPLLAERIAQHLASRLRNARQATARGALLSFVPTLSEGASPALQAVCRRVAKRFSDHRGETQQLSLWH